MNKKAFTLLEVLLAIAIGSVVLTIVLSTVAYGSKVQRLVYNNSQTDAIKIYQQLARDLRSAYLPSERIPDIEFIGNTNSINFVTVLPLNHMLGEFDLVKQRFYVDKKRSKEKKVFAVETRNLRISNPSVDDRLIKDKLRDRILTTEIDKIEFEYFDGTEWKKSWNSIDQLPKAVSIMIRFKNSNPNTPDFKSIIQLVNA